RIVSAMLSSLMRPSPLTFFRAASSLSDSDSNMGCRGGQGGSRTTGPARGSGAEPRGGGVDRPEGAAGPRIGSERCSPKGTPGRARCGGDAAKKAPPSHAVAALEHESVLAADDA